MTRESGVCNDDNRAGDKESYDGLRASEEGSVAFSWTDRLEKSADPREGDAAKAIPSPETRRGLRDLEMGNDNAC